MDCDVLAALAREAFWAREVKSFQVQLVQQYSSEADALDKRGCDLS